MSWLDLHIHSHYSDDGEFSPRQLMERCQKEGVQVAALSDHNATGGVKEAMAAAKEAGVTLVPATELDCTFGRVNLHLLGYWIDPAFAPLLENEAKVLGDNQRVSRQRVRLAQQLGLKLDEDRMIEEGWNGVVSGEHIIEAALANAANDGHPLLQPYRPGGARADNPLVNFYWDYCAQGKPIHVPIQFISLKEALRLVHGAGGIGVLAHPGNNLAEDEALLRAIAAEGISGMEVYSSYHTAAQTAFYEQKALELSLAPTCGSDYHGKIKPTIEVGSVECHGQEAALWEGLQNKR